MPTVVEKAIMFTCRSSSDRLRGVSNGSDKLQRFTYRSSVFREGDFSTTVRCELYVPSSRALIGDVLPSIRSYSAELKLTLSLSMEAVGGMLVEVRSERLRLVIADKLEARRIANVDELPSLLFQTALQPIQPCPACMQRPWSSANAPVSQLT